MPAIVVPGGMSVSLELLESNKQVKDLILQECAKQINAKIVKAIPNIKSRARVMTTIFYIRTTIFKSLVNGELAGHFGLRENVRDMQVLDIIYELAKEIQVRLDPFRAVGNKFTGSLIYEFMYDHFKNILSMPQARVGLKTGTLPWLSWLLLEGDRIIISNFEVDFRPGYGRSKKAIMISSKSGAWRVPPWAAGTRNDNWLTRGLKYSSWYIKELKKIIEEEVVKVL